MNTAAPSLTPESLAERIAWMHEPVHLRGSSLPWFLRWYLEWALHRMFCTLEQGLLLLMKLQTEGKLQLCLEQPQAEPAPRASRYKLKFPPITPARAAGRSAVLSSAPEAALQAAASDAEAAPLAAPDASPDAMQAVADEAGDMPKQAASAPAHAAEAAGAPLPARAPLPAHAPAPVRSAGPQRLVLPSLAAFARRLPQELLPSGRGAGRPRDRCHKSTVCKPVWALRETCA